ncbi:MAG: alpha amylase catalytic region [Sphingobacteriaceae bacterium]|jgi:starch synthase (maltosyl-transferring)|nr:alpha amylase catalytic region [Sphingobacteriaceae bacterium]
MTSLEGRKRVIISNVFPRVDDGKYPAKAAVNQSLTISASIFCDGHDTIAASALIRHSTERTWREIPMKLLVNDLWEAPFKPEKTGFYEFNIQAWIDHFTTWKKGLRKKAEAGQTLAVELQIGAGIIEKAAAQAPAKDKYTLLQFSHVLRDEQNPEKALLLALSDEPDALMFRYRDKNLITRDSKVYRIEVERQKALYSSWYELFPRSTAAQEGKHGTFNDVKKLLPRIAKMGFDTLYFPPIHPIGEINRKGKNNSLTASPDDPGSPWAIGNRLGGHKAIHPQLGTIKDFKSLLAEANKHGIEIALDIAYQCAPDHPYVKEHPQWFTWRPDGTVQYAENPPKKYEDILPFNFETDDWQNLWQELKSVIDYWIEVGVSVFRIDNPHTKSFAFWEWMIGEVRKQHPEVIFLAEAFTRPRLMERLGKAGFNQSYTYFSWRNTKQELEEYINELVNSEMKAYFRPNFWPNTPDILPDMLVHGGENAHIMRLILAATLSSSFGIYGPVYEFCINEPHPGKEEYTNSEKYEIKHWDWNVETRIAEVITRINRIRKNNQALHDTYNIQIAQTTSDNILCYVKTHKESGNILIMAVNLDPFNTHGAHVKIPVETLAGIDVNRPYVVHDLLSSDKYRWIGEWNYVQLNPYEMPAHIFRVEQ